MPREVIQPEGIWDARDAKGHSAGTGLQNGNGRFAQVVKIGDTVYVAGQTPVDAHGQLVGKGDIEVQARQVFENIGKCLEAIPMVSVAPLLLTVPKGLLTTQR